MWFRFEPRAAGWLTRMIYGGHPISYSEKKFYTNYSSQIINYNYVATTSVKTTTDKATKPSKMDGPTKVAKTSEKKMSIFGIKFK